MWPAKPVGVYGGLGALAVLVVAAAMTAGAESGSLEAARAAAQKAAAEEKTTFTEWNAKEMARSATREIIVAARATLERAQAALAAAEESLQARTAAARTAADQAAAERDPARKKTLQEAAARAAAEQAAAQRLRDQRAATVAAAADKLVTDQGVGDRAASELLVIERKLADKVRAARAAERCVLALELACARAAAASAIAAKTKAPADGNVAARPAPECADCEKAQQTAAAEAACRAVRAKEAVLREVEAATAWEAREWALLEKAHVEALIQIKANTMQFASDRAAAVKDPQQRQALEAMVARARTEKAVLEKDLADKAAAAAKGSREADTARALARGGLKPLDPAAWDYARARHLLVRAGFGGTPEQVARLHALGLYGAVDSLVEFQRQPAANVPLEVFPPERADPLEARLRIPDVKNRVASARQGSEGGQFQRLRLWWLRRLVESPRPLQEKLTLFWHGHFATQYSVVRHSYALYQQNQLFREHAAGNFGALLYGIVHDPVMLRYLDNNTNVKGHANENLAREIMELFAMGVDQGYTEQDIREAARALTGYTYDPATGQFRFLADKHDDGPKTIFGRTGAWTGDDLVQLLLEQPATSRFIAGKLFRYFAHDDPTPQTVEQLASVLRQNNYELTPTLKNLFLSEEFYSERSCGTQIKSPLQLVVGLYRDVGLRDVADYRSTEAALRTMGQELFEPPDVKGWREGRSWVNANRLFVRYNAVAELLRDVPRKQGRKGVDLVALLQEGKCCSSPADVVEYLARACLVRPLSPEKRQALLDYVADLPAPAQWSSQRDRVNERLQGLLVLLLSLPEAQVT